MSQERPIRLNAGSFSLDFERWSGWIRWIRMGGEEMVRAIYANVRDANWKTLSQRVTHCHVSQGEGSFSAQWNIELNDLDFSWEGRLECDGALLTVDWIGRSHQAVTTRRTGVCVLHPMELRASPCEVGHSDGTVEEGSFPDFIQPDQPFLDIRSIQYRRGDSVARIQFDGETFEMEDQRNWTDASYKTYCRPQAWPQPYEIADGEEIHHQVQITGSSSDAWQPGCRAELHRTGQVCRLPRLGVVSKRPVDGLAFVLDPEDLLDWTPAGLGRMYAVSGQFVELNRNRPDMDEWDGVAYQATPQVHAFDERSIMENVFGLAETVRTARAIANDRFVCVGPVRMRRTNVGRDPRLDDPIGPAWFLASMVVLASAGADAVCFMEEGDFRGPMREALDLLSADSEIELLDCDMPYRCLGFRLDGTTILINLRPYATSVHFENDIELEPYQIWIQGQEPKETP